MKYIYQNNRKRLRLLHTLLLLCSFSALTASRCWALQLTTHLLDLRKIKRHETCKNQLWTNTTAVDMTRHRLNIFNHRTRQKLPFTILRESKEVLARHALKTVAIWIWARLLSISRDWTAWSGRPTATAVTLIHPIGYSSMLLVFVTITSCS